MNYERAGGKDKAVLDLIERLALNFDKEGFIQQKSNCWVVHRLKMNTVNR